MANIQIDSSRVIKFHADFYCIGFNVDLVKKGVADNRFMCDVDKSKNWNSGVKVCAKIYYKAVGLTRNDAIKQNNEIWCYSVVN